MRRPPILATLVVAAAVATMIGLGGWQLQRAGEKERLLAGLRAAQGLPPANLDAMLRFRSVRGEHDPPIAFRRVRITCHAGRNAQPQVRAGRNRVTHAPGWSYYIPCFWDEQYSWLERLQVNVGWSERPDIRLVPHLGGHLDGRVVEGMIGVVEGDRPIILTADQPLPPLEASAAPTIDQISNNHLFYAFQWFFFAAAALVIYLLALRRRLSREGGAPKSPRP